MTTESSETQSPRTAERPSEDNLRDHHGSLRSKLVLSLAAMFFVFLTIDEMVRQQVIKPEFAALERAGAIRDANRVMAAINANVDHLSDLAEHWAGTAALEHLREDVGFKEQQQPHLDQENMEWVAAVMNDGSWRWLQRSRAIEAAGIADTDFRELAGRCLESDTRLLRGMTRIGGQSLMMFAAVESPSADDPGPQCSRLVVGRAVDQALVETLRKQTQVDFTLQSLRDGSREKKLSVWEADDSILVVEFQLAGLNNQQLANLYVQVPRDITAHSSHTNSVARNSFIFGAVGALLLLLLLLQRIVIGPLTSIREHSDRVAEQGLETDPLVLPSNDEIGELASAFDNMMLRLRDTQTQLAEASRAAGRSQVASTVIHNVGNVLTNVNSLLDVAAGRVDGLRIEPLSKLADCLRGAEGTDGGLMDATPDYLQGLAESLDSDRETISQLISTLHDNVRHIHDVIRDQQRHTGHELKRQSIRLQDLVDEAIGCCRARLDQDNVQVSVNGDIDVDVQSDHSLLLQTVINVIGNGRHATRLVDQPRTIDIIGKTNNDSVSVSFRDNGIGMNEETLARVFDAHFTTKKTGSGLGLHFCAITLKRLGGSIEATSDGPGQGATFIVTLPLAESSQRLNSTQAAGAMA